MAKGIFFNVSVQKLIQRGFKPKTGYLSEGLTAYSKTLPKTGTCVTYAMEGDKVLYKAVKPGKNTYASRVNNIEYARFNGKRMMVNFGIEHRMPTVVIGDTSKIKEAIQYNAQLRKEGYDLSTRMNALDLTFA